MELQENPREVQIDKMSWGTNWSPTIIVAVDKDKDGPSFRVKVYSLPAMPMFSAMVSIFVKVYSMLTNAMSTALAPIRQRTERKARINLPPSSPSRGPRGRMDLIIPKRRILNKDVCICRVKSIIVKIFYRETPKAEDRTEAR